MKAGTERHQQTDLDPLSEMISNFLGSVNSGTISIDFDKQPVLRLVINHGAANKINLEFGQKFMEMLLDVIISKIRNLS
jgi:hypothetical protein